VRNVGYKAVRPARGRTPAPDADVSEDPGLGDTDAYDSVPEPLADPLRSQ